MGLREKVALTIILIIFIQIICASCSTKEKRPTKSNSNKKRPITNNDGVTQPPVVMTLKPRVKHKSKAKRTQISDKNHEAIRKQFNFPDVEYPTASTPRPPFYLQETNILQRNPVQRTVAYPTSTTVPYHYQYPKPNRRKEMNSKQKYLNNLSNNKSFQKPGISKPEYSFTTKPYNFREGGLPNVEYSINGRDKKISNKWIQTPSTAQNTGLIRNEADVNIRRDIDPIQDSIDLKSKTALNPVNSEVQTRRDTATDQKTLDNTITQKTRSSKSKKPKKQNTTPAPSQDFTKSTTPFLLTPYTTLFYDTTPLIVDSKSSPDSTPKKLGGKRKLKTKASKKDDAIITTTAKAHSPENHIESYSFMPPLSTTTSLPQETVKSLTISKSINELVKCAYISNDTMLSTIAVTSTPSYRDCDIKLTPTTPFTICNDEGKPATRNDNMVASIYDANHSSPKNIMCNESPFLGDNVINSNKSSSCDSNINYALSSQDSNIPSIDEEFTTDSYPDCNENILPAFTVTTSTISPLTISTIDDTWVNSGVIDPYKSLSYPDELEEYYILVS